MFAKDIDLKNFEQEVIRADKKVLLDFWAPWCGPCRMVVPIVEEIAEEHPELLVGKINVDQEAELANRYGIMTIPTLLVMEKGKIINKAVGARSKEDILNLL